MLFFFICFLNSKEIEKIPFFMKEAPENLDEAPDLVALQEIKYASEESTREGTCMMQLQQGIIFLFKFDQQIQLTDKYFKQDSVHFYGGKLLYKRYLV